MIPLEFIVERLATIMGMGWSPDLILSHLRNTQTIQPYKLSRTQHRQIVRLIKAIGRLHQRR